MPLYLNSRTMIFVHGIFGWGPEELPVSYWGDARGQYDQRFDKHEVKCGPVSSFHDRACELFAQIYGGDFIYDPQRARTAPDSGPKRACVPKSERPGTQDRIKPNWSAQNPVILVAHSAGAHTCLKLQQLLAKNYWGVGTNADWIEAIICIAGVLNGSTLTYHFSCDPVTGLLTGTPERLINATVEAANFLAPLGLDGLTIHPWLEQWTDKDAFARGTDNLAYDLTLVGCRAANANLTTHPNTYYLSLVTGMPNSGPRVPLINIPIPWPFGDVMNPLLRDAADYQTNVQFAPDKPPLPNWGATDELKIKAWQRNDGAVSSISQRYPFTAKNEPVGGSILSGGPIQRGSWYFEPVENVVGRRFDHLDPVFGYQLKPNVLPAHQALHQWLNGQCNDIIL